MSFIAILILVQVAWHPRNKQSGPVFVDKSAMQRREIEN
jgi:hypothetical protein